jgi:hypothetical protein
MKPGLFTALVLGLAVGLPSVSAQAVPGKSDSVTSLTMKRVADRYALTNQRISALVDNRRTPPPLPATLPNPFYRPTDLPQVEDTSGGPAETVVPAVANETDEGTLAKFAATVRISGLTVRNGVQLLTLNGTLCKAGDTIPLEIKGRTTYIQVIKITPDELTLGLNQDRQTVRVKH